MKQFPSNIDGAEIVCYTPINDRHEVTKNCVHRVEGESTIPTDWLAIGKYLDDGGYYLFYGTGNDTVLTQTFHESVKSAISQAEFEYAGTNNTWEYLN